MDHLSTAGVVIYYIAYPIFYILNLIIYVLTIINAPLFHLGHYFVYYTCWYPIHILAKFEPLYIFFGVAVVIGILTGTSLHYVSAFSASILNLESTPEEERGRTLSSYRARKREILEDEDLLLKQTQLGGLPLNDSMFKEDYMDWKWSKKDRARGKNGLIPNTILEEDSTEDGF